MVTPPPFLFDRIQCSWLYHGMFNIYFFMTVAQVSHKPINVNDMSELSKQYENYFNFFSPSYIYLNGEMFYYFHFHILILNLQLLQKFYIVFYLNSM